MARFEGPMRWVDLLDPDEATVRAGWAGSLDEVVVAQLCAPAVAGDLPHPGFRIRGRVILAVFLLPLLVDGGEQVVHQEVDLVLGAGAVLTVRKTPASPEGVSSVVAPYDTSDLDDLVARGELDAPGKVARVVADDAAEAFLDVVDRLVDRIDALEDRVESGERRFAHRVISGFRHDLLHLRRLIAPTRDAVRRVVDERIEIDGAEVFPRALELEFADVYDKLLRAGEALETARELIGGVRDYVQAEIANDQNEIMKRLTVAASVLLLPTFIVGLYGQNFTDIPELSWSFGYWYSWGLIVVLTVVQLWWFRRKRWI